MNIRTILMTLLLSIMLGHTAVATAQSPDDVGKPPSKEQMERVRKRVETLRMWRLSEALDLDEATSARLFPILNKYDKRRIELQQAIREGMRELRESVKGRDREKLKKIIEKLELKQREMERLKSDEFTELKTILTVEQQAKYILFQVEFENEIRKIIMESQDKKPGNFNKGNPQRPFNPGGN